MSSAFAVSYKRAAAIAGITDRQLDYWRRTDMVVPSIVEQLSAGNTVRLYTLQDMVELVVVSQLRDKVSLQHIRRIVAYLRENEKVGQPLRELRFAVDNGQIYFQLHDGTWYGERRPTQAVAEQVIPLEPIEARVRKAAGRAENTAGRIERIRKVRGSQPVFAGTRVPVSAVLAYLRRGLPTERILDAFPDLTEADIEAARQHAA